MEVAQDIKGGLDVFLRESANNGGGSMVGSRQSGDNNLWDIFSYLPLPPPPPSGNSAWLS